MMTLRRYVFCCLAFCAVCAITAVSFVYGAADELGGEGRGMKAVDLNKGQSDQFKFSSQLLTDEEKKDMAGIRRERSRKVEDLNKGVTDGFKMNIQPRRESLKPAEKTKLGIEEQESLSSRGNVKTPDKMSEQYKKK
jgi:hypothetical protein